MGGQACGASDVAVDEERKRDAGESLKGRRVVAGDELRTGEEGRREKEGEGEGKVAVRDMRDIKVMHGFVGQAFLW